MRNFLIMIIGGLIGILPIGQAVSANSMQPDATELRNRAIKMLTDANTGNRNALNFDHMNCTPAHCQKSATLAGACTEIFGGCNATTLNELKTTISKAHADILQACCTDTRYLDPNSRNDFLNFHQNNCPPPAACGAYR